MVAGSNRRGDRAASFPVGRRLSLHVISTRDIIRALSLAFVLVAVAVASQAQTIYSVGVYSMGRTHEHDWTIGSGGLRFGFEQYQQYQDASGRDLYDYTEVKTKGFASPRYTTFYCGPVHFRVHGPAWCAAAVALVSLALLLLLVIAGFGRTRRHQTQGA